MLRRRQQTKLLLTSMLTKTLVLTASSLRRAISTSVKKVTRSNFEATLEKLRADVRESDFVAIDLEMTGVTSAPWRESFAFDDFEVQYLKLKDSAEKFGIMQFGVCPFRWDRNKKSFVANPYNFYTFPRKELPIDVPSCEFLCQTSSIEFLARHQFDFNAYVNDGISYLSKRQETEALHTLSLAFEKKLSVSLDNSVVPVEIPLSSTADYFFTERMKNIFIEWRNGILKGSLADGNTTDFWPQFETIFFKRRPAISLDGFNSHHYNLIEKVIKKYFRDLVYVSKVHDDDLCPKNVVVYSMSDDDKASLMKEVHEDLWNKTKEKIRHAVGVRHVIDLLASEKKLIVGHSCNLDLAHIFSKFIRPLPSTMTEFACSLHECFPYIIDTKNLLNGNDTIQRLMDNKRRSLSSIFSLLCPELSSNPSSSHSPSCIQHVKIEVPIDGTGNSGAKHEAGYDAFMTGCVFAQECSFLGIDFKHQMGSLDLSKNEKLQKHINLIYPSYRTEVALNLKTGAAEVPINLSEPYNDVNNKANIIFLWGFPSKINPTELRECILKALGAAEAVMSIFFLDESAALVQFNNQDSASKFLVLKDSLECKKIVSSIHPLSPLLEGGSTHAADYAAYKEICRSSASKVLFADQAETLDIRWTTKLISSNPCSSQADQASNIYLEETSLSYVEL